MTCAVLILEATSSPLAAYVTPAWLARCAAACALSLSRDVAPYWGAAVDGVRAGSDSKDVRPNEMVFAIVDAFPSSPGAVAYHDKEGNGVPVAFLALSTCNTLDDVSEAISHELDETDGDEECNDWIDDGDGHELARELSDAVEANSYPIDLGDGQPPIMVSDFLLPAFFAPGASGPYCFTALGNNPGAVVAGTPAAPFQTATGGYQLQRTSGGSETQITAQSARPRRKAMLAHPHWSSRLFRRGA